MTPATPWPALGAVLYPAPDAAAPGQSASTSVPIADTFRQFLTFAAQRLQKPPSACLCRDHCPLIVAFLEG